MTDKGFESCVNSKYSKTEKSVGVPLDRFESCVNSKYSKTEDCHKAYRAGLRAV